MATGVENTIPNDEDKLTELIIRVIKRIHKNENRACYQNILDFAKRDDKNLEMDTVKEIIRSLLLAGKVINIGKGEKKSFKVAEVIRKSPSSSDIILCDETILDSSDIISPTQKKVSTKTTTLDISETDVTLNDLECFVNDKFHETLKSMITAEVISTINSNSCKINERTIFNKDYNNKDNKDKVNEMSSLKKVIELQQDDINYFRNQ